MFQACEQEFQAADQTYNVGDYQSAVDWSRQALAKIRAANPNPRSPEEQLDELRFLFILGQAANHLRDSCESKSAFLRVVSILEQSARHRASLSDGVLHYEPERVLSMYAYANHSLANLILQSGNAQDAEMFAFRAVDAYQQVEGKLDKEINARFSLINCLIGGGHISRAAQQAQDILKRAPDDMTRLEAWSAVYRLHRRAGNPTEAVKGLLKYYRLASLSGHFDGSRDERLSRVEQDLGTRNDVIGLLEETIRLAKQQTLAIAEMIPGFLQNEGGVTDQPATTALVETTVAAFEKANNIERAAEVARFALEWLQPQDTERLQRLIDRAEAIRTVRDTLQQALDAVRAKEFASAWRHLAESEPLANGLAAELKSEWVDVQEYAFYSDPQKIPQHVEAVRAHLQQRQFKEAIDLADRLLAAQPDEADARALQSEVRQRNAENIAEYLQRAHDLAAAGKIDAARDAAKEAERRWVCAGSPPGLDEVEQAIDNQERRGLTAKTDVALKTVEEAMSRGNIAAAREQLEVVMSWWAGHEMPETVTNWAITIDIQESKSLRDHAVSLSKSGEWGAAMRSLERAGRLAESDGELFAEIRLLIRDLKTRQDEATASLKTKLDAALREKNMQTVEKGLSRAKQLGSEAAFSEHAGALKAYRRAVNELQTARRSLANGRDEDAAKHLMRVVEEPFAAKIHAEASQFLEDAGERLHPKFDAKVKQIVKEAKELLGKQKYRDAREKSQEAAAIAAFCSDSIAEDAKKTGERLEEMWQRIVDNFDDAYSNDAVWGVAFAVSAGLVVVLKFLFGQPLLLSLWIGFLCVMALGSAIPCIKRRSWFVHDDNIAFASMGIGAALAAGLPLVRWIFGMGTWSSSVIGLVLGFVVFATIDAILTSKCPAIDPNK